MSDRQSVARRAHLAIGMTERIDNLAQPLLFAHPIA
jgi:hypothetical protein